MKNSAVIVGIDEAGRGALAGPVVAGACVIPEELLASAPVRDSKELTPLERDSAFEWIEKYCIFGYGMSSNQDIDTHGILAATEAAMQKAIAMLAKKITPTYLLVDGRDKFWFDYPHSSIIRGDQTEPCISAGSIVAKVTRDRLMIQEAVNYPLYGFAEHKGYGAPAHIAALQKSGPCSIHRKTFLRSILGVDELAELSKTTGQSPRR